MLDELEELKKMIGIAMDEVEGGGHLYRPLETRTENAVMLLYLIDIAKPILRCRDKTTRIFNRKAVEKRIEKLITQHAEKAHYAFNLTDILQRERAFEHLKYTLSTGQLIKRQSKTPLNSI